MTKRRKPPLALWLGASLLVAALIGGLVGALVTAHAPEAAPARVSVVSRAPAPGAGAARSPAAPVTAPLAAAPAPVQQPLAAPVQRLGAPLVVLAVVDDETGAPVTAFDVTLLPWEPQPPPLERLKTREVDALPYRGPSGIFRKDCKAGRYDVVVRAAGYLPAVLPDMTVPPELPGPVPVRLAHGPSITGLVYDGSRLPVPGVSVFLELLDAFTDAPPPRAMVATTGADGRFRFSPLPPGEYALTLLEPDNRRDRLASVMVHQGTTDVSLFLAPRHQLVVAVRDSYGRPISDAEVELRSGHRSATGRTRETGQAVLRFLPDGDYSVSVRRQGYAPLGETLLLQGGQGEQVRWYTLHEQG